MSSSASAASEKLPQNRYGTPHSTARREACRDASTTYWNRLALTQKVSSD